MRNSPIERHHARSALQGILRVKQDRPWPQRVETLDHLLRILANWAAIGTRQLSPRWNVDRAAAGQRGDEQGEQAATGCDSKRHRASIRGRLILSRVASAKRGDSQTDGLIVYHGPSDCKR
jgi:hypothetical protein